jgi:hypothetical protein
MVWAWACLAIGDAIGGRGRREDQTRQARQSETGAGWCWGVEAAATRPTCGWQEAGGRWQETGDRRDKSRGSKIKSQKSILRVCVWAVEGSEGVLGWSYHGEPE